MIVADMSALVSLATADTLRVVFDEFDVQTTETVIQEVERTAKYDDVSGDAAESVLDRGGRLAVHAVENPNFDSSRIDDGEASCAALVRENGAEFLLTDDLRALPELEAATPSQVAISPIVLKALVKRGVYTDDRAREKVEQIAADRDWLQAPIYRRAMDLFE